MNRTFFSFLLVGLLVGCMSKQTDPLPVSEEALVNIMFDVHIAEGALASLPGGEQKDSLANEYYDQIVEIHQIDRAILDTCLAILQRNPELSKDVYEELNEMVKKRRLNK